MTCCIVWQNKRKGQISKKQNRPKSLIIRPKGPVGDLILGNKHNPSTIQSESWRATSQVDMGQRALAKVHSVHSLFGYIIRPFMIQPFAVFGLIFFLFCIFLFGLILRRLLEFWPFITFHSGLGDLLRLCQALKTNDMLNLNIFSLVRAHKDLKLCLWRTQTIILKSFFL